MAYLVRTTARAERDLDLLYEQINATDSIVAHRWYGGLKKAILSFAGHPNVV